MNKYEVCLTIYAAPEVRLPGVDSWDLAAELARSISIAYPEALVEIAHDGLRWLRWIQ